jgi:hypothetical protein
MPPFGPIKRTDLIHYLQQLGFDGPTPANAISSWCASSFA